MEALKVKPTRESDRRTKVKIFDVEWFQVEATSTGEAIGFFLYHRDFGIVRIDRKTKKPWFSRMAIKSLTGVQKEQVSEYLLKVNEQLLA
jgi:hypothetical protein